jgi:hypothetical protein
MAHLIANTVIRLLWKDILTSPVVGKKRPMTIVSKSKSNDKVSLHSNFFWTDFQEIFYDFTYLSNKTQRLLFARTVIDTVTNHASTGLIILLGSSRKIELLLLYIYVEQPQCSFDQYLVGSSEPYEFNILT